MRNKKGLKLKANTIPAKNNISIEHLTKSAGESVKNTKSTRIMDVSEYSNYHEEDTMEGLFFILRGQYVNGLAPTVTVVDEEGARDIDLGGYNPETPITKPEQKWYMVMDRITFHCIYAGGDLEKGLSNITKCMVRCRTPKRYFREVCEHSSEDYYETHYLGMRPLNADAITKKAEGRCPRVSPIMKTHYRAAYLLYGQYFNEKIKEAEERAVAEIALKEERKQRKNRKRKIKLKKALA